MPRSVNSVASRARRKKILKRTRGNFLARKNVCTFSSWKARRNLISGEKAKLIADYFNVSVDYLMTGEEKDGGETYYLNEETTKMAQSIFENKDLRMLFDAAQDATAEDLQTVHSMLLALKRKERGNVD